MNQGKELGIISMLLLLKNNKRKAMTLLETIIAMSILATIGTIVFRWFQLNSQYNKRITKQFDCDGYIRNALWEIHKELKTSHTILYPRVSVINNDRNKNIISDTKLIFRNFQGDIGYYYYDKNNKQLIKEIISIIPYDDPPPSYSKRVIGKNLDRVIFTNKTLTNNLVGVYIESGPSVQMDSVYLMNY